MRARLKSVLLRALIEGGGRLPGPLLYALGDVAAAVAWLASPRLRAVTRDHIDHLPGLARDRATRDRIARGCVRAAAYYWVDMARTAPLEPAVAFDEYVRFEGLERLFAALDRGCGVVLVTAHVGAPEFAVRAASHLGLNILALTERNPSPEVNELLHRARRRHGARFEEVGVAGARAALQQLRAGGTVALIADRDILRKGHAVPLFGERTTLPTGPIDLALRTGATVVPCWVLRRGVGRYSIEFTPPLELERTGDRANDLDRGLLALARALEAGIARAPAQWFALEPIWRGLGPRPHVPQPASKIGT